MMFHRDNIDQDA